MNIKEKELLIREIEKNEGILRLVPTWVPRTFLLPGRRLKLHPNDLYILGTERGGINERWLASSTQADNGINTPFDEGLSYIVIENNKKVLLKDAIELLGEEILGKQIMVKYGGWRVMAKFFDNLGPIPFHIHPLKEHAEKVRKIETSEGFYFPTQLNLKENNFPYMFIGLSPRVNKEDVKECFKNFEKGDNGILYYSQAYKLQIGTGWFIPAGMLHAPGSLVTYEVREPCDVFTMFQTIVEERPVPKELLIREVPEKFHLDPDYYLGMIDWEKNADPELRNRNLITPRVTKDKEEMIDKGYIEKWIIYGTEKFSAKELTILPGRSVIVKDEAPYGLILIQGKGYIGSSEAITPTLIRYGELTQDEFFVTYNRAKEGIKITNTSQYENMVILKHFGPQP